MMRTIDFYFDFDVPWARERFKSKPDDFSFGMVVQRRGQAYGETW